MNADLIEKIEEHVTNLKNLIKSLKTQVNTKKKYMVVCRETLRETNRLISNSRSAIKNIGHTIQRINIEIYRNTESIKQIKKIK